MAILKKNLPRFLFLTFMVLAITGIVAFLSKDFYILANPSLNRPYGLRARVVSPNQINLIWQDNTHDPNNEDGFKIERRTVSSRFAQIARVRQDATAYSDTGLRSQTTYYYRVRAYKGEENSRYSNEARTTTGVSDQPEQEPPLAPSNLSANPVSSREIQLTWTDISDNEIGFKIEQGLTRERLTEITRRGAGTESYNDTGLRPETTYYYQVKSYNTAGEAQSNVADATTLPEPAPDPPTELIATPVSAFQINLSWQDNSDNEEGFKIERAENETGPFSSLFTASQNATSYQDYPLNPNTAYYYKIYAFREDDNSSSATASATTLVFVVAPSDLSAQFSSPNVILVWTDSPNETAYKIERGPSANNFDWDTWVGANTTTYTDSGVSRGETYYYRISAWHNDISSDYSNTSLTIPLENEIPNRPTNLRAEFGLPGEINLNWRDNSNNELGFVIEGRRRDEYDQDDDGDENEYVWIEIWTAPVNTTNFVDAFGLEQGTTYRYRVFAFNDAGDSAPSNEASAAPGSELTPAAPSGLTFSRIPPYGVELRWQDNSGDHEEGFVIEEGYEIEYDGETGVEYFVPPDGLLPQNTTRYTSYLTPGRRTYYRVYAYNVMGNSSYAGPISILAPPTTPPPLLAYPVSPTNVELEWTYAPGFEIISDWKIYRGTSYDGGYTQIGTKTAPGSCGEDFVCTITYTDAGRAAGTFYYYRFYAHNDAGDSDYSYGATHTLPIAPLTLSAVVASLDPPSVRLSWPDVFNNEAGYQIMRGTPFYGQTYYTEPSATTFIDADSNLVPGETYNYWLYPYAPAVSPLSYATTSITIPQTPPRAPSNLDVYHAGCNSVVVSWQDNSNNEDGFKIERRLTPEEAPTIINLPINTSSYVDIWDGATSAYYYRVCASNELGNSCSGEEIISLLEVIDPPLTPENLTANWFQSWIDYRWDYRPSLRCNGHFEAIGFVVERKASAEIEFSGIISGSCWSGLPPGFTPGELYSCSYHYDPIYPSGGGYRDWYRDLNVTAGETYTYRVKLFYPRFPLAGYSDYSR